MSELLVRRVKTPREVLDESATLLIEALEAQVRAPLPEMLEFFYHHESGWIFQHVACPENDSCVVLRQASGASFWTVLINALECMERPSEGIATPPSMTQNPATAPEPSEPSAKLG